ncbi:unnamed protein product [Schistosoma mattheei]|uniref:Uncharacterized protein n=1 Tax=Schistosoma mattheei TaxID=31246 RepID=A0A183PP76_9TREM|nr:unnamed protein product [Schistosoma mattheei]
MTVEKATRKGNIRQLYDTTKKLTGNYRKPEQPVKTKEGKVITNIEEQQNKWVEHFKEHLNRPALLNPPNIEVAPKDLSHLNKVGNYKPDIKFMFDEINRYKGLIFKSNRQES